jgi:4-alpha-glucanotransferase
MNVTQPTIPRRSAGILLHVTSLPGPWGIGDLGPQAHRFVDTLARAGQSWWQILPLGPPGSGDSPYQCFSAFAGNPLLISPDLLVKDGLITSPDLAGATFRSDRVDYPRVRRFKDRLLHRAWQKFSAGAVRKLKSPFERFCREHADWLDDFALFMSIKEAFPNRSWADWPHRPSAADRADSIARNQFAQFLLFRQLQALRQYAHRRGVRLIGDLPIFVSHDSADVWSNPRLFKLNPKGHPKVVAGVPPDYFSATGQRWGNPLYHWPAMQKDRFAWWIRRFRAMLGQVDLVRIDHFRGFAACWEIPSSRPTAQHGRWVCAPGQALFDAARKALGGLPFIAEDLGLITPDVERLRDSLGLPGMRVLQFAFEGAADNPFLPHNFGRNTVVYTGTHDNDTTVGWFAALGQKEKANVRRYLPHVDADPPWELMRMAWSSVAQLAIAPAQDVLGLGRAGRMNVPGRPAGNWRWRMTAGQWTARHSDRLAEMTRACGR